jgi:hypothetical protein
VGPDIQTQYLVDSLRNPCFFWAMLSSPACKCIEPKYVFQIRVVTEPYCRSADAARLCNGSPERLDISVSSRQIAELYSLLRTRIPAFGVLLAATRCGYDLPPSWEVKEGTWLFCRRQHGTNHDLWYKHYLGCLILENGTDGLSRNIGNKLPIYSA